MTANHIPLPRIGVAVIAASMLSACAGSQPPIGAPGAFPQERVVTHLSGSSESLLYASGWGAQSHGVEILAFPDGALVASFVLPNDDVALGMCSNSAGNVFITASSGTGGTQHGGRIYEFSHGGTLPISLLEDGTASSDYIPDGCSIDPTTDDLAVGNIPSVEGADGNIAIYPGSQGPPVLYSDPGVMGYFSTAYDGSGNLFVFGYSSNSTPPWKRFIELKRGSGTFTNVKIKSKIEDPLAIQWDGVDLAILGGNHGNHSHPLIYRVAIAREKGSIVGTSRLLNTARLAGQGFSIYDGVAISPVGIKRRPGWELGFWKYPTGGDIVKVIKTPSNDRLLAVSNAPSHNAQPDFRAP